MSRMFFWRPATGPPRRDGEDRNRTCASRLRGDNPRTSARRTSRKWGSQKGEHGVPKGVSTIGRPRLAAKLGIEPENPLASAHRNSRRRRKTKEEGDEHGVSRMFFRRPTVGRPRLAARDGSRTRVSGVSGDNPLTSAHLEKVKEETRRT